MQRAADVDYVCDVIPASTESIQLHSKKKKIPNMNITKILLMTTRFFLHGAKMAKLLQY